MTVLLSISDGMDAMMNDMMTELAGGISIYPADSPMAFMTGGGTPFSIAYVADIEEIDHVEDVVPMVLWFIPTPIDEEDPYGANFGDPMGVTLRGVDFELDVELDGPSENLIEGTVPEPGADEVILGSGLAAFGRAEGGGYAEVGGTFTLLSAKNEPITLTVVGIFETGSSVYDFYPYTDIVTARELAGISGDGINYIHVEVDSTENVEAAEDEIVAMFEEDNAPLRTMVATDRLQSFNEMMGTFSSFLWIVSLVAAIAGGISIFIVMLISVVERTKEFGILKASGWSNRNIIVSVIVQSLAVAILGAFVGLGLGYAAGFGIDKYLSYDIAVITWILVLTIIGFGLAMGVLGGLYPAVRAARVSPIESMRAV
jgi:putative ABC transport system permease protein